ncbi:CvpA family protein [Chloroflexota bacterium]
MNIVVILIFIFSFLGGIRMGAVNALFALLTTIIAIPITGVLYGFVASWLAFLPGENWEHFFGFFITLAAVSVILSLIFFQPRHMLEVNWGRGLLSGVIGGIFSVTSSAIGLFLLVLLLNTYPIIEWLKIIVADSVVLTWLVVNLNFLCFLLPQIFRNSIITY